jgi:endonuclease YncB( thermonuclease family)
MRNAGVLAGLILAMANSTVSSAAAGYFDLGEGAVLETGDTWSTGGERYRLYGVQSCLRGTSFTDKSGKRQDCGDASLSVLAAFIKDTHPYCAQIATSSSLRYVVCFATVNGERLDLGTMLITEGYAFAALNAEGLPVNPAYSVAEQEARARKSGLWQFQDVPDPSIILGRAIAGNQGNSR